MRLQSAVGGAWPAKGQSSPLPVSSQGSFFNKQEQKHTEVSERITASLPARHPDGARCRARHLWSNGVHGIRRPLLLAEAAAVMLFVCFMWGVEVGRSNLHPREREWGWRERERNQTNSSKLRRRSRQHQS